MCRTIGAKNGTTKYDKKFADKLADKLLEWINIPTNFWLGKFAEENKINRKVFERIAETSEKFADAYSLAQQIQENRLALLAMHKKIDVTFAIFSLKNVAGWRDGAINQIDNINNVTYKWISYEKPNNSDTVLPSELSIRNT